jgi:hypothetical protein
MDFCLNIYFYEFQYKHLWHKEALLIQLHKNQHSDAACKINVKKKKKKKKENNVGINKVAHNFV